MKKCRALILLLTAVLLGVMLTSCTTSAQEITVTLKITAGEDEVFNDNIKLSYADPTVLTLVSEADAMNDSLTVVYNDAGDSVKDINDYLDTSDDTTIYFWEYTINGVLPANETGGKAGSQPIVDGDVVEYVYSSMQITGE
ncbi:MAG: hypothetical protein WCQ72_06600 [Eubacteriales bacterium]